MKNTLRLTAIALVFALISICFISCGAPASNDPWDAALYTEDTTLGEGSKTIVVEVTAYDKTVEFTINTDAQILGEVLMAHGLVAGEVGEYGLYIKTVNGILADYDVDQNYWAFYSNGEYMMTGVDTTEIFGGEHYELVRQK